VALEIPKPVKVVPSILKQKQGTSLISSSDFAGTNSIVMFEDKIDLKKSLHNI